MAFRKIMDAASSNFTSDANTINNFIAKHGELCLLLNEKIQFCLEQINRDFFVVTDRRIIYVDTQGISGQKVDYQYIGLSKLCYVGLETAGMGLDDTDLILQFVAHPIVSSRSTVAEKRIDISKQYDIRPLYQWLLNVAIENEVRWNKDAD